MMLWCYPFGEKSTFYLFFPLHLFCLLISSVLAVLDLPHLRFSSLKWMTISNSPNTWILEGKGGCFSVSVLPLPSLPSLRQTFEITSVPAVSHSKPLTHRSSCSRPVALTKKPNQNTLLQHWAPQPPAWHYEHVKDLKQWQKLESPECLHEITKPWKGQQQGKSVDSTGDEVRGKTEGGHPHLGSRNDGLSIPSSLYPRTTSTSMVTKQK